MVVFSHFHKNIWLAISVSIILFCLSLTTFNYLSSSYTKTISKGISLFPLVNNQQVSNQKIHVKEDPCTGRYIYMHDLPTRFNHDLLTDCRDLNPWFDFCPYLQNDGFGPRLAEKSWYDTNQFMLSLIFHNRMKNYECLTRSSLLASAIYAPYYPGLDVGRYLWGGFSPYVKDATALDFAKWLRGEPEWARMSGRDHFFIAGRITWDFRRSCNATSCDNNESMSWGSVLLNLPEIKNMTMLTIESNPYENNDIAIPYPTYFHPATDTEVLQWQDRIRRRGKRKRRRYLFAFGGGPRPNTTGSVRGELIKQCKTAVKNNSCLLVNCWGKDDICNNPRKIISLYMKSDFCLQPPGDSYTRRSIFDSIIAGCIPVFFHPGSAYVQYLWHFPKNYTKYSVFVPIDKVKNGGVMVKEVLSKISNSEVLAMREEVIKMIPKVVYGKNKMETFEDAFDVALKGVLQRIDQERRWGSSNEEGKEQQDRIMKEWESYF